MQQKTRWIALALGAFGLIGAAAMDVNAGTVTGKITYSKIAPKPSKHKITQDKKTCAKKALYDESLVVGKDKGLANVVVSIERVANGKAAEPGKVTIDQSSCAYIPHVSAATLDSKLIVKNSDPTLHNVHAYVDEDSMFNLAMPMKGMKIKRDLDEVGVVLLKCDAGHTWMSAYVVVFDHPYFSVTGKDGSFSIADVPKGTYTVKVWHEKLGTKTGKVTVDADGSGNVDLSW